MKLRSWFGAVLLALVACGGGQANVTSKNPEGCPAAAPAEGSACQKGATCAFPGAPNPEANGASPERVCVCGDDEKWACHDKPAAEAPKP
jgi:hypothetical protein